MTQSGNKYRTSIFWAIGLLSGFIANSQQSIVLQNHWEFLKQDIGGIWEAVRPVGKGNPESVPVWEAVTLPHCVNARDAVDPDVAYYQGPSWYRTQLQVHNPYPKGRTLLHFEGAGQQSDVYIYTTKVATHKGGYDEWTVDITDAVAAFQKTPVYHNSFHDKVPVSIRTDNSRDLELIPSDLSDFNLYGGLYRKVHLVYVPEVSIDKLFMTPALTRDLKNGSLTIRTRIYGADEQQAYKITYKVFDPSKKLVAVVSNAGKQSIGEQVTINIKNIRLWTPDIPQLYTVQATIYAGSDSCVREETIGFRQFEFVTHGPFLLNGKRLLLKGTQRHEDGAGVAAALTDSMVRQEFRMMKEMGVNFIRLGHFQNSSLALKLCDSLGILAWEEIPWCRGGLGGEQYKAQARQMLTNMIEQHYNHPAIIIWGLGNENDWPGDFTSFDTLAIRNFMKELNTMAHTLDPNRKTAIRRCDFCKDIVDVYSPSIWAGWYRGIYTEYKDIVTKEYQRVDHFLHAEWGGDSHAGRYSENPDKALQRVHKSGAADERAGDASLYGGAARVSKDGDWSESYICNLFDWHLKEQENMPWLTGSAQWIFKDFSTPIRPDNPVPYVNQKGLLQRDMTPKEGYYVFQSYWAAQPMVHIFGHNQPVRWGTEGEQKMIKVYSNCDEAELWVNGKSLGIRKRNSQDFPAAGLRWELPMYKGSYQVKVLARKGKQQVSDELQFVYQSEQWGIPAKATLQRITEKNGIATIEIRVLDQKGNQCLDAAQWVRFGLTGDGRLVDDLGTPTGSRFVQLYNGRAQINVETKGQNVISASVEKLKTVFLTF